MKTQKLFHLLLLLALTTSTLVAFDSATSRASDKALQSRKSQTHIQSARKEKSETAFQVSTLPALSLGLYDGVLPMREVLKRGNFGLGTLDALDGEVIILKGKAWQVSASGHVAVINPTASTPFAIVTKFSASQIRPVTQPTEYLALRSTLDNILTTPNIPYAIQISGTFSKIRTRSVARQSKPYKPLAEVTKTQSVFEMQNVKGTLVGFRFPSYLANVNLADYHFHFISDDKTRGGHLLDCELASGEIKVQPLRNFEMMLPQTTDFDHANLAVDQSEDLKKAETGK